MMHPIPPPEVPPLYNYRVKRHGWLWAVDCELSRRSDSTLHRLTGLFFWTKTTAERVAISLNLAYLAGYNNVARFYEGVHDAERQADADADNAAPEAKPRTARGNDCGGPIQRLRPRRTTDE